MGRTKNAAGVVLAVTLAFGAWAVPARAGDKVPDDEKPLEGEARAEHEKKVDWELKQLQSQRNREGVRQWIEDLGRKKGRVARDVLIRFATGNKNQEFVRHAFMALAEIKGKTVLEYLTGKDALTSRDFFVQVSAAEALGNMKDAGAVPALIGVTETKSTKIEAQGACLLALGKCGKGNADAAATLLKGAEAKQDTVRANALEGLGYLESDEAVKTLAEHLQGEKNTRCRAAAATGLGKTGSKDAIPYLQAALKGDDAVTVREAAAAALRSLGVESEKGE